MSEEQNQIISEDGTCKAHLQIMKCIKQYLREKGKLYWGSNATWKRAKLMPDDTVFGSYCEEVERELETLDTLAFRQEDPFYSFGNKKTPFGFKKWINHFQDTNPSWTTSQIIAHHIISKTNSYYKQSECFIVGEPQEVRIVNQWFYRKQHQVKTVYGNIYTTNSTSKVGWMFSGIVNDETMTIQLQ